jgi:septal ring factor EnvC (AmiA/AmiB activator)
MVRPARVAADIRLVDDVNLDRLREELAALEAAEARLSAERRRLHNQIDFGYSASEALRAREREMSDERRDLHRRIDSLRELLGMERKTAEPSAEKVALVRELDPNGALERLPYPASG